MLGFDEMMRRDVGLGTKRRQALRMGQVDRFCEQYQAQSSRLMLHTTAERNRGYTDPAMADVFLYRPKMGALDRVRGVIAGRWLWVLFCGTEGCIMIGGFGWGYRGTGPAGLIDSLTRFGADRALCWDIIPALDINQGWMLLAEQFGCPAPY